MRPSSNRPRKSLNSMTLAYGLTVMLFFILFFYLIAKRFEITIGGGI